MRSARWPLLLIAAVCAACGGDAGSRIVAAAPTTSRVVLRVTTIGQASLPAAMVHARSTTTLDSATLGVDGRATIVMPNRDSVELSVDVAGTTHYGSAWRETFAHDTTIDVVLMPRTWTVQRGIHAGATRTIDLPKGIAEDVPDTHFLNRFSPGPRAVAAWPLSALPIAVGLDTTGDAPQWTTQDSLFFWDAVAELNVEVGRTLFRPVSRAPSARVDAIGVTIDLQNFVPRGSLSSGCDAGQHLCGRRYGQVWMSRGASYPGVFAAQNRRVVKHELLHTLGFGHSCYWPSLMMITVVSCVQVTELPPTVTADDVAYLELMFDLATALEAHPSAWSLDEALHATLGPRAGITR